MKKIHSLCGVFAGLILASNFVSAEALAAAKIGLVDMQRCISGTKRGKAAKDQFVKTLEAKKKEIDKEEDSIKKESEAFQKGAAALSEKARMERGMKLQSRVQALQEMVAKSQGELQGKEAEMTRPIVEGLQALIPEIARARNLDAVFEAQNSGVLWALDKTDISDELIKKYDEKNK